jgi:hypothetical protein
MMKIIEGLSLGVALYFSILIIIKMVTYIAKVALVLVSRQGKASITVTWQGIVCAIMWATFYTLRQS